MQQSILKEIQNDVQRHISIISHLLKVNIEIVDTNHTRIASTGIFKNSLNQDTSATGYLDRLIFATLKTQINNNPRESETCKHCPNREHCTEMFQIGTPIFSDKKLIGVIALVATSEEQKNILENDIENYIIFLEELADLLGHKAQVHRHTIQNNNIRDLFNNIYINMDDGVIIANEKNIITHINKSALVKLYISSCVGKKIHIQSITHSVYEQVEFLLSIDDAEFIITGKYNHVYIGLAHLSMVITFTKARKNHLEPSNPNTLDQCIIGQSAPTLALKHTILKITKSKSSVLITGESGTGKELVASMIWRNSERKDKPFVPINCGAIPGSLIESELFGYSKGAFTGASRSGKIGKFEQANEGIIFLDEIGDMPLHLQTVLLRVLQEKAIVKIGSNEQIKIDVRVITATNKDLKALVAQKLFREDLYYRINVIPMHVKPLRERREDIPTLLDYFLSQFCVNFNIACEGFSPEVLHILHAYAWPGNVRELENIVEYAINMLEKSPIITVKELPDYIIADTGNQLHYAQINETMLPFNEMEKMSIEKALKQYGYDTEAKKYIAKQLGIGMTTLYRKIKEHQLET